MPKPLPSGTTVVVTLYLISDKSKTTAYYNSEPLTCLVTKNGLKLWRKVNEPKLIKHFNEKMEVDDFRLMTRLEVFDYLKRDSDYPSVMRH